MAPIISNTLSLLLLTTTVFAVVNAEVGGTVTRDVAGINAANSGSYCGKNFDEAKSSCNRPCVHIGIDTDNCDQGEWCFGPNLMCTNNVQEEEEAVEDEEDEGATMPRPMAASVMMADGDDNNNTVDNGEATIQFMTLSAEAPSDSNNTISTNSTNSTSSSPTYSPIVEPTYSPVEEPTYSPILQSDEPTSGAPTGSPSSPQPSSSPTTEKIRLAEERRGIDNPELHYCGSTWDQAIRSCNDDLYAIPCPDNLPCPTGQHCMNVGTVFCTPLTRSPSTTPTLSPTTTAPTTNAPSASPIGKDEVGNAYFCGVDEASANTCRGQWCRYGPDAECPDGQSCYLTTSCNATDMNYTSYPTTAPPTTSPSVVPTGSPSSPVPTEDLNPGDYYCSDTWKDGTYDGECGIPCPGGQSSECPQDNYCYSGLTSCTKTHKVGVSNRWCGATFEAMFDTCHQECPNGTDEECPDGETCWADSPCVLVDSKLEAFKEERSKLWCARNYKHLVEYCPKPCPDGSDESCGNDEDGNPMTCFNMADEPESCTEEGVGIREPVDPDNLWCGNSWNDVLENCAKKCPEGTDEECGFHGVCYDLTGNEPMICKTEGYGVKKKGDPNKRFCGSTYNAMMEFCPRRCPNGDECPSGETCYEESPCKLEGQSAPGFVKLDSSKMYCGGFYGEAAQCANACPGGSDAECPSGMTCWADVSCNYQQPQSFTAQQVQEDESSNLMMEVTIEIEGESDSEPAPAPEEAELEAASEVTVKESESQPAPAPESNELEAASEVTMMKEPAPVPEPEPQPEPQPAPQPKPLPKPQPKPQPEPQPEPAPEPVSEPESNPPPPAPQPEPESNPPPPAPKSEPESNPPPPAPKSEPNPPPAKESNPPPPPAKESANPPPTPPAEEISNPPPSPPAVASKPATQSKEELQTSNPTIEVDNLRMALYGLSDLSAAQLMTWEDATASYFEDFYNDGSSTGDNIRDSVADVSTEFDVTSLNLSGGRRKKRLLRSQASQESRELEESAYLLTYTQTIEYSNADASITAQEIVQHPFQSSAKRAEYVAYLRAADPELFRYLSSVSAVMVPVPFEAREMPSTGGSAGSTSSSGGGGNTSVGGNPFGEVSSSSSSSSSNIKPASSLYSSDFFCHNSGAACTTGECAGDDLCMFVPPNSNAEIAPFLSDSAPSPDSAANLVSSVLAGNFEPPPSPSLPTQQDQISQMSASNPQPRPQSKPQTKPRPQPEQPSTYNADANEHYMNNEQHSMTSKSYGPSSIENLQMTLHGVSLRSAREVFEWQYLTAIWEQMFYNDSPWTDDHVQNSVYAVATSLEATEVAYTGNGRKMRSLQSPSTTFTFKQTTKYSSVDPQITIEEIVTQPFSKQEYREAYVEFLKSSLPETFGALDEAPTVAQTSTQTLTLSVALIDTFFCSKRWPVDCASAQQCQNDSDCPEDEECLIEARCASDSVNNLGQQQAVVPRPVPVSQPVPVQQPRPTPPQMVQNSSPSQLGAAPYHSACNLCSPNQVGVNNPVNFNGRLTDCQEAYDFMAKNYDEGSANCVGAQRALSKTCCRESGAAVASANNGPSFSNLSFPSAGSQNAPTPSQPNTNMQVTSPAAANNDSSPSSPTKITISVSLKDEPGLADMMAQSSEMVDLQYPSNTYYCGTSMEDAANSCSIPCPSSLDSECPGNNLKCFGNTQCMNRESFYCGSSWLDASDKCSKPCPNGDALECDAGEACFAWTSCENTESFYCGVSFDDANSNCALPCPTRSSLDCPDGQGCFAYTTCEGTIDPPHEVDPLHVPMNDYFCGETKELASSTCSIACQGGDDSECPGDLKCYDGTGCSNRDSFWCGPTWMEAAEMCTQPCSSGSSDECPSGESCFAHTGCQANLFFCGDTFEDAGESCSQPCESRSSKQCPGDQLCFAFVTACASEANPFSPTTQPVSSQSYSFGIANFDFDSVTEEGEDGNSNGNNNDIHNEENPNWYTKWEGSAKSASSLTRAASMPATFVLAVSALVSLYSFVGNF